MGLEDQTRQIKVFTLDTVACIEDYQVGKGQKAYGIQLEVLLPPTQQAREQYVKKKALFDFYEAGMANAVACRKIAPLRRKSWQGRGCVDHRATQRNQSPGTRSHVPVIEIDGGFSGPGR